MQDHSTDVVVFVSLEVSTGSDAHPGKGCLVGDEFAQIVAHEIHLARHVQVYAFEFLAKESFLSGDFVRIGFFGPTGLVSQGSSKDVGVVGWWWQMVVSKHQIIVQMKESVGIEFHGVVESQLFHDGAGEIKKGWTLSVVHVFSVTREKKEAGSR